MDDRMDSDDGYTDGDRLKANGDRTVSGDDRGWESIGPATGVRSEKSTGDPCR